MNAGLRHPAHSPAGASHCSSMRDDRSRIHEETAVPAEHPRDLLLVLLREPPALERGPGLVPDVLVRNVGDLREFGTADMPDRVSTWRPSFHDWDRVTIAHERIERRARSVCFPQIGLRPVVCAPTGDVLAGPASSQQRPDRGPRNLTASGYHLTCRLRLPLAASEKTENRTAMKTE
jgi:hypothetical protein